jgi:hypothetical protein
MVVATMTDRAALLVGDVTDKILSQLRLYGLAPQIQQDASGYRGEFVVVLGSSDRKAAFAIAAQNLKITIK